jgi:hypothetical protein
LKLESKALRNGRRAPERPKGEKRSVDVIGNAVNVVRVLAGGADNETPDDGQMLL